MNLQNCNYDEIVSYKVGFTLIFLLTYSFIGLVAILIEGDLGETHLNAILGLFIYCGTI